MPKIFPVRRFLVQRQPLTDSKLVTKRNLGSYDDLEAAQETAYFEMADDPAPDNHLFYRIVIIDTEVASCPA